MRLVRGQPLGVHAPVVNTAARNLASVMASHEMGARDSCGYLGCLPREIAAQSLRVLGLNVLRQYSVSILGRNSAQAPHFVQAKRWNPMRAFVDSDCMIGEAVVVDPMLRRVAVRAGLPVLEAQALGAPGVLGPCMPPPSVG